MTANSTANGNGVRNVLVTGGAGFIGSHVAEALRNQGCHVEVFDNLSAGSPAHVPANVSLQIGDVRSDGDVQSAFRRCQFAAVVHCAAQTSVARSMLDPELDRAVNVAGTRRLAAAAREAGVRRFVFLSSGGAIYGETTCPANERTLPAPRSYYGFHKYAAEEVLALEGLSYAILRPSNVYGPRQRADAEGGVVAIFLERLLRGEPLEINGSGEQVRDFVHISDVVGAVLAALKTDDDVLWNVASGEALSILSLSQTIAELMRVTPRLVYCPPRAGDVTRSLLDPAKLQATGLVAPPLLPATGLRLVLAQATRPLLQPAPLARTRS